MYTIKEKPDDFIVDEQMTTIWFSEPQKYAVYILKKQSLNTIQVVDMITKHLRLKANDIGFAGIKDRHAITTQYVTIPNIPGKTDIEKVLAIKIPNISLTHCGYYHKHVSTPMLVGNRFTITVRNLEDYSFRPTNNMVNYFGEQRFSKNNADIGYAFIKKDFKRATELLLAYASDESKQTYNERKVKAYLTENPTDHIGALRQLPGQTCKFFLHAYQSKLWNETVSFLLKKKKIEGYTEDKIFAYIPQQIPVLFPTKIPAIGFFYDEDDWDKNVQDAIEALFLKENITERDFVIKQMSEVTEPGAVRQTIVQIEDLKVLEQTKDKLTISFTLQRGCYATMALRHLLQLK